MAKSVDDRGSPQGRSGPVSPQARQRGASGARGKNQQGDADVARLDVSEVAEDAFVAFQQAVTMLVSRTYFRAGQDLAVRALPDVGEQGVEA
jgi:hypothetical protein